MKKSLLGIMFISFFASSLWAGPVTCTQGDVGCNVPPSPAAAASQQ